MIVHCSWKLNLQIIFYPHLLLKYYFFLFSISLFLYSIQSYSLRSNSQLSLKPTKNQVLVLVDLKFDITDDADGIGADIGHIQRILIEAVVVEG